MMIAIDRHWYIYFLQSNGNIAQFAAVMKHEKRSSMDFFANFQNLPWAIFDAHRMVIFLAAIFDGLLRQPPRPSVSNFRRASVGQFSWSDLRWTFSPTFKTFLEQFSTRIGWEFYLQRSSMDFFANFQNLPWAIFEAHRMVIFLAAIFDGLLLQLPRSSLSNFRRASVGQFSWSDLRWSSPSTSSVRANKSYKENVQKIKTRNI